MFVCVGEDKPRDGVWGDGKISNRNLDHNFFSFQEMVNDVSVIGCFHPSVLFLILNWLLGEVINLWSNFKSLAKHMLRNTNERKLNFLTVFSLVLLWKFCLIYYLFECDFNWTSCVAFSRRNLWETNEFFAIHRTRGTFWKLKKNDLTQYSAAMPPHAMCCVRKKNKY